MSTQSLSEVKREGAPSKVARWGWAILIAISALLILNGAGWFFMGPSLAFFEVDTGVSLEEFRGAYPTVTRNIATNARQVAIWFMAFGALALLVALEGYRHNSRWAWNAAWALVAAPAAVGINVLAGGEGAFGFSILAVAAVALAGQLLAGKGLAH
jgi:hypothetical protein